MGSGTGDHGTSALRPLEGIREARAGLQNRVLDAAGTRQAVLQIADAVELSLRRVLRDHPEAPSDVRRRALASDDLRADEVLGELRQRDRISMELAASVHELLETRRRLLQGASLQPEDAPLALRVLHRLEPELTAPAPGDRVPSLDPHPLPLPDSEVTAVAPPPAGPLHRRRATWLAALALLAVAFLGWLAFAGGEDVGMERGITLFRSGAYADAAHHFHRYAQANPDEATPHLYLARIHRRMRRPDLAGPALREAMRLAPDDAAVHRELGFLLLDTDRAEVAVERFRTALRMDRESPEAWIGLVRALHATGREEAARRVLAQAPTRVREMFARGRPAAPQP